MTHSTALAIRARYAQSGDKKFFACAGSGCPHHNPATRVQRSEDRGPFGNWSSPGEDVHEYLEAKVTGRKAARLAKRAGESPHAFRLRLLPEEALADFERIIEFLLETSPQTAKQTLLNIRSAVGILEAHPLIGRRIVDYLRHCTSFGFDTASDVIRIPPNTTSTRSWLPELTLFSARESKV